MKNKPSHFVIIGYIISVIALFLYSYTQVDLNLTLSRASIVQSLQKSFQYIGFYNRPLSTVVYIGIITLFYLLYFQVLSLVKNKSIDRHKIWKIIYILVAVLVFSYPAFLSYDFFNYMFTAKTILVYHKNPYETIPLMFAGIDPWLNFMRWTHLSTAYAPLWIFFSLIPYLLGFGYFILIMVNMKLLIALFYLLACTMIEKILSREKSTEATFGLALFALNPLIIVETLVSSHNDIVLSAFALMSLWYLTRKDMISALFWLSMSIASKLMTIMLVPLYAFKKAYKLDAYRYDSWTCNRYTKARVSPVVSCLGDAICRFRALTKRLVRCLIYTLMWFVAFLRAVLVYRKLYPLWSTGKNDDNYRLHH